MPFAREIRNAAVRGETHPALAKLRKKLGLTRPTIEYQELQGAPPTHEGTSIDPLEYVVARNDGTVWVGSTPNSLLGLSSSSSATTTTATINEVTSTSNDVL